MHPWSTWRLGHGICDCATVVPQIVKACAIIAWCCELHLQYLCLLNASSHQMQQLWEAFIKIWQAWVLVLSPNTASIEVKHNLLFQSSVLPKWAVPVITFDSVCKPVSWFPRCLFEKRWQPLHTVCARIGFWESYSTQSWCNNICTIWSDEQSERSMIDAVAVKSRKPKTRTVSSEILWLQ